MDDSVFDNAYSMSAVQIDNFLNQFPNSCISPNSTFRAQVPHGYTPSGGFTYSGNDTAGVVIATAAQVYGINPQVLITTLQKEQSLVTGGRSDGCPVKAYTAAAGYGCPDNVQPFSYTGLNLYTKNGVTVTSVPTTCVNSAVKAGFSQQVIRAAWLLKFSEERSKGNINWAIIKGNWNNSDDPQSCYSGYMTEGTFQRCPSDSPVYYSGVTSIDGSAVHMDTGATASLYRYTPHFHGNQLFNNTFTGWFGNTIMPYAFKSANDPTIYLYISGYKLVVSAMAVLQDYGVSPESIQTVSQTTVDSIPSPAGNSGISSHISSLIKTTSDNDADGGSIYLVSAGKKYQIQNMNQFNDFAFDEADIVYLPAGYVTSLPGGGQLSNFVRTPTNNVFQVSGGQKRIIFDYGTYKSLNPSDNSTFLSYFLADSLASGNPIANSEILVKPTGTQQVFLYTNGTYYGIPTNDTYRCWGFEPKLNTPVFSPAASSYIAAISPTSNLNCLTTVSGTTYLLNSVNKLTIPGSYNISGATTADSSLSSLAAKIPTHGSALNTYVKSSTNSAVYYIENGIRKLVPTYNNFVLLNAASHLDVLDPAAINTIPISGIKLATGTLVKTSNSPAVYAINGNSRVQYTTSANFLGYGNDWPAIETYAANVLDAAYPYTNGDDVQGYYYDGTSKTYAANERACYTIANSELSKYGLNQASIASGQQNYTLSAFPKFNTGACKTAPAYAKSPDSAVVYWLTGGQKRPFSGWSKLVDHAGNANPDIITIDTTSLNSVPTGSTVQ